MRESKKTRSGKLPKQASNWNFINTGEWKPTSIPRALVAPLLRPIWTGEGDKCEAGGWGVGSFFINCRGDSDDELGMARVHLGLRSIRLRRYLWLNADRCNQEKRAASSTIRMGASGLIANA